MATTSVKSNVCVKCGGLSTREQPLSLVGSTKGKREGHQEGEHPLDKLLQQSRTLQLETLTKTLENNARENAPTYIHSYCRTFLNNKCRPKRASKTQEEAISAKRVVPQNVSSTTRSTAVGFNFKSQGFYCTDECVYDKKTPSPQQIRKMSEPKIQLHLLLPLKSVVSEMTCIQNQ